MTFAAVAPAHADVLDCGSVLDTPGTTVVLTADVDCTTSGSSFGVLIDADNVTFDLNGHTILGDGLQPTDITSTQGVYVTGAFGPTADNVIVKNGTITGFNTGVYLEGTNRTTLTGLNVHDNLGPDASSTFGDGIQIFGGGGHTITQNQVSQNGPFGGVRIGRGFSSNNNTITANAVRNNTGTGIAINGSTNTIRFNKAFANSTVDLADATAGCDANVWKYNTFGTESQVCIGTSRAEVADFNADGNTDVSVFRPSNGTWYVKGGATVNWGTNGDIAVPGDYNGDGTTDLAVFRPSDGIWYVLPSGGGPSTAVAWGTNGDIPVPGDYNGDNITDMAVFRPSDGTWYVNLSGGGVTVTSWGTAGDIPVPGDYNTDGSTDIAVFRPSTGTWYVLGGPSVQYGMAGDVPVPGDYRGTGGTDIAIYRPST
ncbi:MAG: right-handed parallel beta-helix repeat-containing protein, partial [Actinomycetota bacterium]|nr:right-handed parallel beta-helix repeat-containing protein [Actinomycetota bacterium]